MTKLARILLPALLAAAGGCALGQPKPYPLYGTPAMAPSDGKVAILMGPIATVDGQDVRKHGRTFALLPRCHVVTLLPAVGETTPSATWVGNLPHYTYAMDMSGGYYYAIHYRFEPGNGPVGNLRVWADETDPAGALRPIGPAGSGAEIHRCWHP
jgi:hypothetical protein